MKLRAISLENIENLSEDVGMKGSIPTWTTSCTPHCDFCAQQSLSSQMLWMMGPICATLRSFCRSLEESSSFRREVVTGNFTFLWKRMVKFTEDVCVNPSGATSGMVSNHLFLGLVDCSHSQEFEGLFLPWHQDKSARLIDCLFLLRCKLQ